MLIGKVALALSSDPLDLVGEQTKLPIAGSPATLKWYNGVGLIRNRGFNTSVEFDSPYHRLPSAAKTGAWCNPPCPVRENVWAEGQNGAGLYMSFRTNATEIWLNATLLNDAEENIDCSAT